MSSYAEPATYFPFHTGRGKAPQTGAEQAGGPRTWSASADADPVGRGHAPVRARVRGRHLVGAGLGVSAVEHTVPGGRRAGDERLTRRLRGGLGGRQVDRVHVDVNARLVGDTVVGAADAADPDHRAAARELRLQVQSGL